VRGGVAFARRREVGTWPLPLNGWPPDDHDLFFLIQHRPVIIGSERGAGSSASPAAQLFHIPRLSGLAGSLVVERRRDSPADC